MKTQTIRLLDVFLLGPLMIAVAQRAQNISEWQRAALALSGVATIVYNGVNWIRAR